MSEQEGQSEYLTWDQFMQAMVGKEVQGTPVESQMLKLKGEPVPGQELFKKRVRVSFIFDVTCNDSSIRNSIQNDEEKQHQLALLKSFLVADRQKLLDMMVDNISVELGMNSCETFKEQFLSQSDTKSHVLFGPAIAVLEGEEAKHWQEVVQEYDKQYGPWLDFCTEDLFQCFSAQFVSSSYEEVRSNEVQA